MKNVGVREFRDQQPYDRGRVSYESMRDTALRRVPRDQRDWPTVAFAIAPDAAISTADNDLVSRLRPSDVDGGDVDRGTQARWTSRDILGPVRRVRRVCADASPDRPLASESTAVPGFDRAIAIADTRFADELGMRHDVQRRRPAAGIAGRPDRQRSSPPVHSLVMRLQRTAGNRAVAGLLGRRPVRVTRPALQRLTDEEVEEIRADKKGRAKTWEKARTLYNEHFGPGKPHYLYRWHGREDWDWFVKQADSVESLLESVQASVAKAVAQKNAGPPPSPATGAVHTPPIASASAPTREPEVKQKPEAEHSDDSDEETKKPSAPSAKKAPKAPKYVPLDLGSVPMPSTWTGKLPSAVSKPPSANLVSVPTPQSSGVSQCTSTLESRSPNAHGGRRATNLTLAEAQQVVAYAKNDYSRSGKVFVIKGAGSGDYAE
jgi:hypothetical protein